VLQQAGFDLGGIDVDPAGDDDLGLAIAQEAVALVVEVADVADGEETIAAVGVGLLGIVVVLELPQGLAQVDETLVGSNGGRCRRTARRPRRPGPVRR
jgi:hypothetical protein